VVIAEMEQSTSWRLTAPLRRFILWVRDALAADAVYAELDAALRG
jgi:hypothetical protein